MRALVLFSTMMRATKLAEDQFIYNEVSGVYGRRSFFCLLKLIY